jgi:lipoate-protein ligase A
MTNVSLSKTNFIFQNKLDLKELIKLLYLKDIKKLVKLFEYNVDSENINLFILEFSKLGGFLHMKIDEFLFKNLDYINDYFNNVLLIRFYQFSNNTITIGKLQKIDQEIINKNRNYLIVRRITGGKAVYHLPKKDLTFSVIGNTIIFKKINFNKENILNFIHQFFNKTVKDTLTSLNIKLYNKLDNLIIEGNNRKIDENLKKFDCFANPMSFELTYNNQKIVGSAIKIANNKFILQANIKLYLVNNSLANPDFINKFIEKFYINFYENLNNNFNLLYLNLRS